MEDCDLGGNYLRYHHIAGEIMSRPAFRRIQITASAPEPTAFTLRLRLPWWLKDRAVVSFQGENQGENSSQGKKIFSPEGNGYLQITRLWSGTQQLILELPKGLTCWPLADEPDTVAFLDGPVLLAGLTEHAHMLYGNRNRPESFLAPDHERELEAWKEGFRTVGQQENFRLLPIKNIGRECYTVYFPVNTVCPGADVI